MSEDRSLDEFAVGSEAGGGRDDADETVDGGGRDNADETVDGGDDAVDGVDEPVNADSAVPTATWTTGGAACDRCGERAARRWFAGGDLVCAACKEW
ncbi:hypothetical protein [Halorubrum sp. CBA1229]|uniref:DUF7573 domain-containing protein n=1 Tax=Halorubrum sp. CBA1229 TaxID=1853699 RepID=UPI000F3D0B16|nr:hypothetical protein [Halorubrum sp. CBA1229]QKY17001.1 hypothetical protein Hrr1229_008955 [Halorubrum sp. CBA1229]